jgi:DNA-binding phage protein
MLGQSANVIQIAKATNLSRQTIYRIKDDPAAQAAQPALFCVKS